MNETINAKSATEKISTAIRGITVPPVIAFLMLTYFLIRDVGVFRGFWEYALSVFFISVLPASAYVVHIFVKNKLPGQEGKRTLAMIFSVVGYILGVTTALLSGSSKMLLLIYLGYCVSGAIILISSKVIKFKISGHAVGSAGPIAILLGFGQGIWVLGLPVILSVIYSSLKIKRHTLAQILCGIAQPFIVFLTLVNFVGV